MESFINIRKSKIPSKEYILGWKTGYLLCNFNSVAYFSVKKNWRILQKVVIFKCIFTVKKKKLVFVKKTEKIENFWNFLNFNCRKKMVFKT